MGSFLQSREWQEIQECMGRKTQRIASVLVIRHDLPLGFHYFYCPQPSVLTSNFFQEVAGLGQKTGAIFLKVDPTVPFLKIENLELKIQSSGSLQPRSTVVIDCRQEEPQLLAAMHPKSRYNIRLAERHGVIVRRAARPVSSAGMAAFSGLIAETTRRDGFSPHPREYYRLLLDTATDQFSNELFFAEYNGAVAAAAIVSFYQPSHTASYLHGGSSRDHRQVMAPHLLHWRVIQEVKRRGFAVYDFGGIDAQRWPGLTRFKQGFGGRSHEFPPAIDCIFRPRLYAIYRAQRRLRHRS